MIKRLVAIFAFMALAGAAFAGNGNNNGTASGGALVAQASSGTVESGIPYRPPINIGTKNFTEQYVVGNLMYLYLKDKGFNVNLKTGMSSTVLRQAMLNGDIDLSMDYTGTMWLTYTGHKFNGESPKQLYDEVKAADAKKGLVWLNPIWCNDTYAIAVTKQFATEHNLKTLSDFAKYVNAQNGNVSFASDFEFYARPDGILGLQVKYGFAFKPSEIKTVAAGLTLAELANGKVDATMVFGTDAAVVKYGWVVLQDDKNFWPPYDLAPYTRQEVLDANPGLAAALNTLVAAFPSNPADARAAMQELNAKVDIQKMEPEAAARQWLIEHNLISK